MPEGALRTAGTAGRLTHSKSQPARRESCWIVVFDHQPRRLRLNDLAASSEKFAQKLRHVRGGSVCSSPGRAELPPVGTVPIPLLGLRVATPGLGRSAFRLACDHVF